MASAKADKAEAPSEAPAAKAVFEALTNIHADGRVFAPGDCVDVGGVALAQLIAAGAVKEL
jgi:hypothetical protein